MQSKGIFYNKIFNMNAVKKSSNFSPPIRNQIKESEQKLTLKKRGKEKRKYTGGPIDLNPILTGFFSFFRWYIRLIKTKIEKLSSFTLISAKTQKLRTWCLKFFRKTKKNRPYSTMIPQVELFLFGCLKNWGYQKVLSKLTDL